MNTFSGDRAQRSLKRVQAAIPWFLGLSDLEISSMITEISNKQQSDHALPGDLANFDCSMALQEHVACRKLRSMSQDMRWHAASYVAGKSMALEALGTPNPNYTKAIELMLRQQHVNWARTIEQGTAPPPIATRFSVAMREEIFPASAGADKNLQIGRDLAASLQTVFELLVLDILQDTLEAAELSDEQILRGKKAFDGIVLTGGCAMNVKANSVVARSMTLPVHIPPAAGDDNLALGAAWLLCPPQSRQPIEFSGPPAWDLADLPQLGGMKADVPAVAQALAAGSVVGVIRGRMEFGPRALGHRSMLALPAGGLGEVVSMKAKLNRLKGRQGYRPASPVMSIDFAREVLRDRMFSSPYMSFAPKVPRPSTAAVLTKALTSCKVQEECATKQSAWLDDVMHLDGSARVQTVTELSEPWLWALLAAVAHLGLPPCVHV